MEQHRIAIFDLDGTLVDAYDAIHRALDLTLREMGHPGISYEEARRSVGGGDLALLSRLVPEEQIQQARTAYRARHIELLGEGARLMPGARELLCWLARRKILIAAATNRSRTTALPLLSRTGISPLFDLVVTAEDVERLKPDPEQILRILSHFSCPPHHAVFVGDMVVDYEAGRRAGVPTIIVLTGSSRREEFADTGALLCENLFQVREEIRRRFPARVLARREIVDSP